MTVSLAQIFRHPIKGIGSESLEQIRLAPGSPLPGDRAWAVAHDGAGDHDNWQPRRNFLVVANAPLLAQVRALTLPDGSIQLQHPDRSPLIVSSEADCDALIDWVGALWPPQHSRPSRIIKSPPEGMADNGAAQVSILSQTSLRVLSQKAGHTLDPRRFRGNLWLEGLAPWEEFDLIGQTIQIGRSNLRVTDRIERCRAIEANPATGIRDVNPLGALEEGWGHRDFGVYATVISGGNATVGDPVIST